METHSGFLAWRVLWTEEPGGLQSMGLQRDRHSCATNTAQRSFILFFYTYYTTNLYGMGSSSSGSSPLVPT